MSSIYECMNAPDEGSPEAICDTVETKFVNVWNNASESEKQDANDVYTMLTTPGENRGYCSDVDDAGGCPAGKTWDSPEVCGSRTYTIYNNLVADGEIPEETPRKSNCEYILGSMIQMLPFDTYEDTIIAAGNETDGYTGFYSNYAAQTNCRFPDQIYPDKIQEGQRPIVNARDACVQQQALAKTTGDNIADIAKTVGDTATAIFAAPVAIAGKAFDAFGAATAKANNKINTNISLSMKPKTVISQTNACVNEFASSQSNVINAVCEYDEDMIVELAKLGYSAAEIAELTSVRVSNITQKNSFEAVQSCAMSAVMSSLMGMQSTIDNEAVQTAMASAEGLGAQADANNEICTSISVDMSPATYVSQKNCCKNTISQEQTNVITAGCNATVDSVIQSNSNKSLQTCTTMADSTLEIDLANAIFNTTTQTVGAEATGITPAFLLAAMLPLILMFGGGAYAVSKGSSMLGSVIGIMMILLGVGSIAYYYTSKEPEETTYNDSFSRCDKSAGGTTRSSWGGAKEKYNSNDSFMGLDFFPDIPKIGGDGEDADDLDYDYWPNFGISNITDDQLGVAVFLTKASVEGTCVDQSDPSISLLKEKSKQEYMIIGIVFIILGIIMTIMGFLNKKDKTSNTSITPVKKEN